MKKDYGSLSEKYRKQGKGQLSAKEVEAYLKARMPATQAAVGAVLEEVGRRISQPIHSILDLGAGPGTAALSACEVFPDVEKITLIEKNEKMLAKKQIEGSWISGDLENIDFSEHDLGIFGYSFGELLKKLKVLEKAWEACKILIIVEPGTPKGYENILEVREAIIGWGGKMIAPCPHMKKCPMEGNDWCHFSIRLERSREHKHLKKGELGWEDEKYSYIAMSKEVAKPAEGRIVRRPQKKTGHVILELCGHSGLERRIVSKKEKALYSLSRKLTWGGAFPS